MSLRSFAGLVKRRLRGRGMLLRLAEQLAPISLNWAESASLASRSSFSRARTRALFPPGWSRGARIRSERPAFAADLVEPGLKIGNLRAPPRCG